MKFCWRISSFDYFIARFLYNVNTFFGFFIELSPNYQKATKAPKLADASACGKHLKNYQTKKSESGEALRLWLLNSVTLAL